jgi:6-phosphogluconolactonase/glucosamine-6-phosphate isomerase/deaminase
MFDYGCSEWAPFRDREVCRRLRAISRDDLTRHDNPDFHIHILPDEEIALHRLMDLFDRIRVSAEEGRRLVLILPQPHPQYRQLAWMINRFRVDCSHLYTFNMDEWADEEGNIAPETWPNGFMYAQLHNFYGLIDEDLRPPREQVQGLNNRNLKDYGKMIEDLGGADLCDGGIGWSGHVAFIEPGAPEFAADSLEEFKQLGPRIVTLSPFTIAQSCLDPDFGMSGDWSSIPPRAATIGPAQVLGARLRNSWNRFTLGATSISWQRWVVRLAAHGPVTPQIPSSILQLGPTNLYISESLAADITSGAEDNWY